MQVDLGDVHTISRVLVYGRTDYHVEVLSEQNLTGLIIQTDDGQEFRPPTNEWYKYDTFFNFVFPTPISTRYVRLTVPDTRILTICELDVYNDRIISYGKSVELSAQYDVWEANRAVDGDNSGYPYKCECCAATTYSESAWLRVDLGGNYTINYVTIYGRTDGTWPGQSYEGMVIEFDGEIIQEIPDSSESKNTTKYFEFRSQRTTAVQSVTLTLSHSDSQSQSQLVLCEIEVFGGCLDGYFGNCTTPCGQCSTTGICNKQTGICPHGCNPGFKGDTCTTECEDGKFCVDCIRCCGMCNNDDICDKFTGNCPNGCGEGFTGTRCLSETIDEQASINIAVLAGSIAASVVITAILTLVVTFSIQRMLRSRSRDEIPSKPQWESNYDSLDLSSVQTSETTSTTPS